MSTPQFCKRDDRDISGLEDVRHGMMAAGGFSEWWERKVTGEERHADLGLSLGINVTNVSCYSRCALDIV